MGSASKYNITITDKIIGSIEKKNDQFKPGVGKDQPFSSKGVAWISEL